MQPKYFLALALVVGLAAGITGWFLLSPKSASAPTTGSTATTTTTLGGIGVQATGQATVTEVDTPAAPKPPAMPALAFSGNLSADAKQALQAQWQTITAQLKSSPNRLDLWLELGVVYKIAGQYDAAVSAWTYITKVSSPGTAYIAWGNLGDLYLNFTHDYTEAAAAYQMALKGDPRNADYQAGLKAAQSHF